MERRERIQHSDFELGAAIALVRAPTSLQKIESRPLDLRVGPILLPLRRLLLLLLLSVPLAARSEPAEPGPPLPNVSAPPPVARLVSLGRLTLLPAPAPTEATGPTRDQAADRALAAAVERGSDPSLEPLQPFRKRDLDLVRGEREIEIGERELVLRWRVRPRTRETLSVELRF